jgi:protoporphyrinogen oxidase
MKIFRLFVLCGLCLLFFTSAVNSSINPGRERRDKKKEAPAIEIKETSRLVYHLEMKNVTGCMVSNGSPRPLPPGSALDGQEGIFYWLPGPGFNGNYTFRFTSSQGKEKRLTVRIAPRFGNMALKPGITGKKSGEFSVPSANGHPFGVFSTPIHGTTVSGSIAVTGWALDDVGVESVKIYRQEGSGLVYIGDAVFVEGARPDVEAAFPGYPGNSAAGWGYMMLTNFLPGGGNGSFTLHAVAKDGDGHSVTLGSKTITCDNAHAVKPFGAIDAPDQGAAISGTKYRGRGWALTPPPNKIPIDGSTLEVIIDGKSAGNVTYNIYRSDIAKLFPGYLNSNAAHGYFDFDTTAYANGLHTISWLAEDNDGNTDGIGSRYFTISNTGGTTVYDAIIVGAGIAGLSSAYFLKDNNIKVLEKKNRVGGRTVSGTYEGFTYAKGTGYLGKPEYALKRIIKELNLNAVEIPEPMDGRYYNKKFYIGYDALEEMMVTYGSQAEYDRFVQLLLGYYHSGELEDVPYFDLNSQLAALDTITAREWFIANNFSSIYRQVYNVASRGLFGASIDEISALGMLPELVFDYADADPDQRGYASDPAAEGSGSYSFITGITEVTDAIANHLGNKIQLNSTVKSVTLANGIYTVSYEDGAKNTYSMRSRTVILAVPSSIALQIASNVLSAEQKSIMGQIYYAPYITVALFSDEPIFNGTFDLAVPDNYFFTDIYDSTWVQRAYDNSLQNKKKYIMGIYIAAQSYKDETLLALSDGEVLSAIYTRLDALFPGASNKVTGSDIQRFPYAYPVMTKGAYTRLTRLHTITTGRLQLAGDYMAYPTFEAAVESGSIAADKIKDRLRLKRQKQ